MSVPHGFNNGTLYCTNVDFRGQLPVVDQMIADGQLLIGATAAPQIRSGFLTSVDTSVTITVGPGTIDLSAAPIITGDIGTASGPNITIYTNHAANNAGASVLFDNSGSISQLKLTDNGSNTLIGASSGGTAIATAVQNTGLGTASLSSLQNGSNNTSVGIFSLGILNNGNFNCAYGMTSLDNTTSGSWNIGLGCFTGDNQNGTEDSTIMINGYGLAGVSNALFIGTATGSGIQELNKAYIHGIYSTSQDPSATVEVVTIDNTSGLLGVTTLLTNAIQTIDGDVGSITGNTVTIFANQATKNCGASVFFNNATATSTLNVTDPNLNTFIGLGAGVLAPVGGQNTSLGNNALGSCSLGSNSVAIGALCLSSSVNDNGHVGIGTAALGSINGSTGITGVGFSALAASVDDTGNSAFGNGSLASLGNATPGTNANNNSAFGCNSLSASFFDTENSAFGFNSLSTCQGGSFNCAFGSQSLTGSGGGGSRSSAFGYRSLFSVTNGSASNVAVGAESLLSSLSDSFNVAIGDGALRTLSGASSITAVGYQAMFNATTPSQCVAEGYQAMLSALDTAGCTATGYQALFSSQHDQFHCAYGDNALFLVNGSNNCSAFGTDALGSLITGQNSTALGCFALAASVNAEGNLGLGYNAGTNIGPTDAFNVFIASNGIGGDNGVIRIGDATGTAAQNQFQATYICGINNFTQDPLIAGPQVVTIDPTTNRLGVTAALSGAIQTINTDVGSVSGTTITLHANQAANDNGASVNFNSKTATTIELQLTDSVDNTLLGRLSGNIALSSGQNTSVGAIALTNITSGVGNSAFGYNSLPVVSSGGFNLGLGYQALDSLSTGDFNIGIGFQTGDNQGGAESSCVLINAWGINGVSNILQIGTGTGTGSQQLNAAYIQGIYSNTQNPSGTVQVVTIDNTTGQLGVTSASGGISTLNGDAGVSVTSTTSSIYTNQAANASGASVLFNGASSSLLQLKLTDSNSNTFLGSLSGSLTSSGTNSTATGASSLANTTTGIANCAYGVQSMTNTLDGQYSCAYGFQSMFSGTSHKLNSAFGYQSLHSDTNGRYLTAIGGNALFSIDGGQYTTAIGDAAGGSYTSTESSNIVINSPGVVGENNTLRIGQATGTAAQQLNQAFISGINGVTLGGTPKMVVIDSTTDQLGVQAIPVAGVQVLTSVTHAASPYTVLASSQFLSCVTSGGTITLLLPNAPVTGQTWTIKDASGAAAASNITITTVGGAVNIDGATTYVLNVNYQAVSVVFNGVSYEAY